MIHAGVLLAAFNLVCSGTQTEGPPEGPRTGRAFEQTYRVDLTARRWCSGECDESVDIERITDRELVLSRSKNEHTKLNRESGNLEVVRLTGDHAVMRFGQCKRRPFTGLPKRKF